MSKPKHKNNDTAEILNCSKCNGELKIGTGYAENEIQEHDCLESIAIRLHQWYLEACKKIDPESYNANAQKPFEELTEKQKFLDRYIASEILGNLLKKII